MKCIGCDTEIQDPSSEFCPTCLAVLSSPTESGRIDVVATTRPGVLASRFLSGTLIADRYRIVRHLGTGGMSIVYQADDLKLNVPVALKLIPQKTGEGTRR